MLRRLLETLFVSPGTEPGQDQLVSLFAVLFLARYAWLSK
jgi:hypothetical protein